MGKDIEKDMDVPFDTGDNTAAKKPFMALADAEKNWKEWANLKAKTINGRDIAPLMGVAPWRTPEELLAEKLKFVSFVPAKGTKEADVLQRGLELQDIAKEKFIEATGITPVEGAIYRNDDIPVMIARIQYMTNKGEPVQIMTTGKEYANLWENGSIPKNVEYEAQWNMALTGAKKAHVGCLVDDRDNAENKEGSQFMSATVHRDDKLIAMMEKEAERFGMAMNSKFLNFNVPGSSVAAEKATYRVTMPEDSNMKGAVVVIPQKMVRQYGNNYRLSLPIKNYKGRSFLFKREGDGNVKSASSAEIFCAVNKVRGKVLFANNREFLKEYWNKKKNEGLREAKESEERSG